jgi:hypothetical protein
MGFEIPVRSFVNRPPDAEPGDWASYYIPFSNNPEINETTKYGFINFEANVIPASKNIDPNGSKAGENPE